MRARYAIEVHESTPERLVIRDMVNIPFHPQQLSVSNDAAAVIADLQQRGFLNFSETHRRVFYYDSDGALDELVHNGQGKFLHFAPGDRIARALFK